MAKVKLTKNELKAQRDSLRRFRRFLPFLQLKKQQLQIEIRHIEQNKFAKEEQIVELKKRLEPWVELFSCSENFIAYIAVENVFLKSGNIAGVEIPEIDRIDFKTTVPDLYATSWWLDDALVVLKEMVRLRLELEIISEQLRVVAAELRVTSQRVNLFEKVKIPEARENIRKIQIALGDQQTAGVARGKISKKKSAHAVEAG